jgi:hypothetical protein
VRKSGGDEPRSRKGKAFESKFQGRCVSIGGGKNEERGRAIDGEMWLPFEDQVLIFGKLISPFTKWNAAEIHERESRREGEKGERDRDRERDRETERQRETHRERDRETERQRQRETKRDREREIPVIIKSEFDHTASRAAREIDDLAFQIDFEGFLTDICRQTRSGSGELRRRLERISDRMDCSLASSKERSVPGGETMTTARTTKARAAHMRRTRTR